MKPVLIGLLAFLFFAFVCWVGGLDWFERGTDTAFWLIQCALAGLAAYFFASAGEVK